ncbi:calponin homology domain-containing protein [Gaertneriomyces semiglobifer]|nr:calponin homology domain-containing protein [Gaertneriomyces semiglobifer]
MSDIPLYGLDKELAERQAAKYDPQREKQAREWIEEVVGEKFPSDDFQESLKNGVLLCKLIKKLSPDLTIKWNESKMPFKQMENINTFLTVLTQHFNVPKNDQFQTIDLYEDKNRNQVVDTVFALSRHAVQRGFDGPLLGPRLAEKREVQFTEEQLKEGRNVIGGLNYGVRRQIYDPTIGAGAADGVSQQMGFSGGANASGVTYGTRRDIGGADPGKK